MLNIKNIKMSQNKQKKQRTIARCKFQLNYICITGYKCAKYSNKRSRLLKPTKPTNNQKKNKTKTEDLVSAILIIKMLTYKS